VTQFDSFHAGGEAFLEDGTGGYSPQAGETAPAPPPAGADRRPVMPSDVRAQRPRTRQESGPVERPAMACDKLLTCEEFVARLRAELDDLCADWKATQAVDLEECPETMPLRDWWTHLGTRFPE
jgi:hypothetical protein